MDRVNGQFFVVRTGDENELQSSCVCVCVEASGQRAPCSELSCLSSFIDNVTPASCHSLFRVVVQVCAEIRVGGRRFVVWQEFNVDVFLKCSRQAHQAVSGMLEVTTLVDYLMLRLRGALQEPWLEDVYELHRCFNAGRVQFLELRGVVADLLSVWEYVRIFVRYTGSKHLQRSSDRVILYFSGELVFSVSVFVFNNCEFGIDGVVCPRHSWISYGVFTEARQ